MGDVMKRYNEVLNAAIATSEAEKGNDITSSFEIYCGHFKRLGQEIETMLAAAPELLEALKEALQTLQTASRQLSEDHKMVLSGRGWGWRTIAKIEGAIAKAEGKL